MPLVQIAVVVILILFAVYLFELLWTDVAALILNAVLIFFIFSKLLKVIRAGLKNLCIASALVVLLGILIFGISGFPIYKVTWFLGLSCALAYAAKWAHEKGYVDLSTLVNQEKKKK